MISMVVPEDDARIIDKGPCSIGNSELNRLARLEASISSCFCLLSLEAQQQVKSLEQ
ncbi:hypothetical protein JCM19233_3048 [Vibrio astriarenae]|nr:hypothetical protein JCM19233_3048 [Vibrio sp. C7]